jgi:hypothetical protein
MFILTFGLMAAGQLLYLAGSSGSLARSKGTASVAAQSLLESLGALYRQDASSAELSIGDHGPMRTEVTNPGDGSALNIYDVHWTVERVPDPRPGKVLNARLVRATVRPVAADGTANSKPGLNKILSVSTVFSSGLR